MCQERCPECGYDYAYENDGWDEDYEPRRTLRQRLDAWLIRLGLRKKPVDRFGELLKEHYLPAMREELNNQAALLSQIERPKPKRKWWQPWKKQYPVVVFGTYARKESYEYEPEAL